MSEQWLKIFLGKIGSYLITFLSKYYYYFIVPLVVYGIFLTISSYNLRRIQKRIDLEIIEQAKILLKRNPGISLIDLIMEIQIPWVKVINEGSFFPFVSGELDMWVVRVNSENISRIIEYDDKYITNTLQRNGILSSSK